MEKKNGRKYKGEAGYISFQKKLNLILTLILFGLAAGIFLTGYIINDYNKGNIFTIFAAIMVIPAAKFTVSVVLFSGFKSIDTEKYNELVGLCKPGCDVYADMVIASTEKAMGLDFMVVTGDKIFGFCSRKKDNPLDIQQYLSQLIQRKGHEMPVTVTNDEKRFKNFLKSSNGVDDISYESDEDKEYYLEERKKIMEIIEVVLV